jgi:hypothetical protein
LAYKIQLQSITYQLKNTTVPQKYMTLVFFHLLRNFHEVESADWNVLNDFAEIGLLAGLGLARVDAVVVLARLVRRALLVPLTFTLKGLFGNLN